MNQTPTSDTRSGGLKKNALGTFEITFLVISAAAPLTVMAGVAPLAISIGGIGAPNAYLFAGLALGIFAIGFMSMTKYVKTTGGFYTYVSKSLGRRAGLGAAFVALVSYNTLQIGLYGLLGVQAHGMLETLFGLSVPWPVLACIAIALVWILGVCGIDVGAKVLSVLLIAEVAILALLAASVFLSGGHDGIHFGSFSPSAIFSPGMAAIFSMAFAAFMGFESTALYREEAKNPDRSVPRATFIAVGFMAVFYAVVVWAVVEAFGEARIVGVAGSNVETLFFTAINQYVGRWAEVVMYILIVTSVYASQLAFHNAINRYTFSLARDGVLHKSLGRLHPRFGSPFVSGTVQSIVALVVVLVFAVAHADPYRQLLLWVNSPGVIGLIALQALTSVAVIVFFVRAKSRARRWYVLPAAAVGGILMTIVVIALLANFTLLTGAGAGVNTVLALITPVAFIVGWVWASVLRRRRPGVYVRIGGQNDDPADDAPRAAGTSVNNTAQDAVPAPLAVSATDD